MDIRTPSQLAAAKAVAFLGGPVKAAALLEVPEGRYQTVQSWLRNRVPAEYCPVIERAMRERASSEDDIVTCEQLRPDIAWEVVRQQPVGKVG
jgi:DNA-binding transcriptional regulator YdaS (Cro superfamily)